MITVHDVDVVTENRFNYLTIPLLLKYSFGTKKSFFANLGPYWSILTNHDRKTSSSFSSSDDIYLTPMSEFNFPLNHALSNKEFGVSLGLGKSFMINNKSKISVELRNNLGLTNRISNASIGGISGNLKTNTINLITEFSFGL